MMRRNSKGNNISQNYQRIREKLGDNQQQNWQSLMVEMEIVLRAKGSNMMIEEFISWSLSLNNQQFFHSSQFSLHSHQPYTFAIKFFQWLLLKSNNYQIIKLTDLPFKIDESINILTNYNCSKDIIPYIYVIYQFIFGIFYNFYQVDNNKSRKNIAANLNYICFPYNFKEIVSIYADKQSFWDFIKSKPLFKLSNFVCDQNYEVWQQNFLADFCDSNCILSTNLINTLQFPALQRVIISKIITLNIDNNTQIITNSCFLNKFEQLTLQKLLTKESINKKTISKQFCLTSSINHKNLNKIIAFFYLIPPEFSPFSKYSIFPYQNNNFTNIFFRIATQGYWQSCPKSQFLEVYYLLNEAEVQWLCIPSDIYKQFDHKFSSWKEAQFQYIYSRTSQIYRGVQRKGQLIIIQNGYEYFWKVKFRCAAFIKWSLLIKQPQFIESYTDIITQYQNELIKRQWRIEIPHRSMILDYLSHQWMHIQTASLKKLIHIVQLRLQLQQSKYISLLEKGSDTAELQQLCISKYLRLCGYCGQQILNYFLLVNKWVYCLDCIQQTTISRQHKDIKYCYLRKPEKLRIFFNQLLFSKENQSNSTILEGLVQEQIINLIGGCLPMNEIQNNGSEKDNLLQSQQITNQFIFKQQDLSLLLFQKRSSFFSSEPLFKHLALKKVQSEHQLVQMRQLMKIMVKLILTEDEKKSLQRQICQFYSQNNHVLAGLNALRNSQF